MSQGIPTRCLVQRASVEQPTWVSTGLWPRRSGIRRKMVLADISHIKLPGPRQGTMLDESHRSISHERRQPSHQAHKTISRRRELAAARQRRQLTPRSHSLPTPPGTHLPFGYTSPRPMTPGCSLPWCCMESCDTFQHLPEYLPRHSHLGKLEHQPPGVTHQPSPDLDELDLHASQRPVLDRLGQA